MAASKRLWFYFVKGLDRLSAGFGRISGMGGGDGAEIRGQLLRAYRRSKAGSRATGGVSANANAAKLPNKTVTGKPGGNLIK